MAVICLLLLTSTTIAAVSAQYTSGFAITNLQYPEHVLYSNEGTKQIAVTFDVTSANDFPLLIVWITNANSSPPDQTGFNGTGTATPDGCVSDEAAAQVMFNMGKITDRVFCVTEPSQQTESFTFSMIFNSIREYNLQIYAIGYSGSLFNVSCYGSFGGSEGCTTSSSDLDFDYSNLAISVTDQPVLTIDMPSEIGVSVDGAYQSNGPYIHCQPQFFCQQYNYSLTPSSPHIVSAPQFFQSKNLTRLRFDHWSDGSTMNNRTLILEDDTTLAATYVTQYQLNLINLHDTSIGAGWYDDGSNATFSTTSDNFLWTFQGWYSNGNLVTSSNNGSIVMDKPHTLTAEYSLNTPLLLTVVVIAIVGLGLIFYKKRRK